jgi:hypothetical protein
VSAHALHARTCSVAVSTGNERSSVDRLTERYGAGWAGSGVFAGCGSGVGSVSGKGSDAGSTSMMRLG